MENDELRMEKEKRLPANLFTIFQSGKRDRNVGDEDGRWIIELENGLS